eukprot:338177-Amphidinium_carterae.1
MFVRYTTAIGQEVTENMAASAFADDLGATSAARGIEALRRSMNRKTLCLQDQLNMRHLSLNQSKSVCIVTARGKHAAKASRRLGAHTHFGQEKLVESSKYLGSVRMNGPSAKEECKARIHAAKGTFAAYRAFFCKCSNMSIARQIFLSTVIATLTFNLEAWVLTETELEQLERAQYHLMVRFLGQAAVRMHLGQ